MFKGFLFILILICSSCGQRYSGKTAPVAKNGVLDLTNWDFEKDGPLELKGEWLFYWKKLITPEHFLKEKPKGDGAIKVPGPWTNFTHSKVSGKGFVTYYLKIKGLKINQELGLFKGEIQSNYRIYKIEKGAVELVDTVGQVGKTKEDSITQFVNTANFFKTKDRSLSLIFHISNFDYSSGYFYQPFTLGLKDHVFSQYEFQRYLDLSTFGIILMMSLYHLILFIQRRADKGALYFSIFCGLICLRQFTSGYYIFWLFDEPSKLVFSFYGKLTYLGIIFFLPFMAKFFNEIFPGEFKKISKISFAIALILSAIVVLFEIGIYTKILPIVHVWQAAFVLYGIIKLFFMAYNKVEFVRPLLTGCLVFAIGVTHSNLITYGILPPPEILSIYLCAFLFSQSYVLSQKFSNAFETAERLTKHLQEEVDIKTKDLKEEKDNVSNLLNNMSQAVFSIASDGNVQDKALSRFTNEIFGQNIVGKNYVDVLFPSLAHDSEEYSNIQFAVATSFGADDLQWDINVGMIPNKSILKLTGGNRNLNILSNPIYNDKGDVEEIMFTVEDVTEKLKLEADIAKKIEEDSIRAKMLSELAPEEGKDASIALRSLKVFLISTDELLSELESLLKGFPFNENDSKESFNTIWRNLHTVKGNARSYSLSILSGVTHRVETELDDVRKNYNDFTDEKASYCFAKIKVIRDTFEAYLGIAKSVFSINIKEDSNNGGGYIELHKDNLQILIDSIQKVIENPDMENINILQRSKENLQKTSLIHFLKNLEHIVKDASVATGKEVIFNVEGDDIFIGNTELNLLNDSFNHILRNSVDHAIEEPGQREALGKNKYGAINIKCSTLSNKEYIISIKDDGKGIDPSTIGNIAFEKGLVSNEELDKLNDDEKRMLIFRPGFSTKDKVSEISGRGVGMDVVKTNVEKIKGTINLKSEIGKGSEFIIKIPTEDL